MHWRRKGCRRTGLLAFTNLMFRRGEIHGMRYRSGVLGRFYHHLLRAMLALFIFFFSGDKDWSHRKHAYFWNSLGVPAYFISFHEIDSFVLLSLSVITICHSMCFQCDPMQVTRAARQSLVLLANVVPRPSPWCWSLVLVVCSCCWV